MSKEFLKVKKGLNFRPLGTEPSDPENGDAYYDLALGKLRVYQGGAWVNFGEGGGGFKNYSLNPDFEANTDGVASSDGGLTFALTNTSGEVLYGLNSLKLSKAASDLSGQYWRIRSEVVEEGALETKQMQVKLFVDGTEVNYINNACVIEVVDEDNPSSVLSRTPVSIKKGLKTDYEVLVDLDDSTTKLETRVRVVDPTTAAFNLVVDRHFVGELLFSLIDPNDSDWEDATVTGTWTTNTTYSAKKKIQGDMAFYQVLVSLAGAPNSATLDIVLDEIINPTNLVYSDASAAILPNSSGRLVDSGTRVHGALDVQYINTNTVRPCTLLNTTGTLIERVYITQAAPITFAAGDQILIWFSVPLANVRASNLITSNNKLSLLTVNASAYSNSGNVIPGTGTPTAVSYDIIERDLFSNLNSDGRYVVQDSIEEIEVEFYQTFQAASYTVGNLIRAFVYIDDVQTKLLDYMEMQATRTASPSLSGKATVFASKGQIVSVRIAQSSGSNKTLNGGDLNCHVTYTKRPLYNLYGAVQKYDHKISVPKATYYRNGTTSRANTVSDFIFNSLSYDEGGLYNPGTGVITAPVDGKLNVKVKLTVGPGTGLEEVFNVLLTDISNNSLRADNIVIARAGQEHYLTLDTTIPVIAGEQFKIRTSHSAGANRDFLGTQEITELNLTYVADDNFYQVPPAVQDQTLYLDTGNGRGSTNTAIRRFSNVQKNTLGNSATYADSVADGMSVTIHAPGKYAIVFGDAHATQESFGISINSANNTTSIVSLTYAQGKRSECSNPSNGSAQNSWTGWLNENDVVRAHTNGAGNGNSNRTIFSITRLD